MRKTNMEQKQWEELSRKMAVEVIIMDLADIMVPCIEGKARAEIMLQERDQQAVDVEYRMGQALIALEQMGYAIVKST